MKLTLVTKVRAKHFNYQNLQISQNKSKLNQTKKRWLGLGFPGLNTFWLNCNLMKSTMITKVRANDLHNQNPPIFQKKNKWALYKKKRLGLGFPGLEII